MVSYVNCSRDTSLTCNRFKGPKVNVDHMMLGREGNVIDGHVATAKDARASSDGSSGGDETKKSDTIAADIDRKNAEVV
jgi:hypothetical protein